MAPHLSLTFESLADSSIFFIQFSLAFPSTLFADTLTHRSDQPSGENAKGPRSRVVRPGHFHPFIFYNRFPASTDPATTPLISFNHGSSDLQLSSVDTRPTICSPGPGTHHLYTPSWSSTTRNPATPSCTRHPENRRGGSRNDSNSESPPCMGRKHL